MKKTAEGFAMTLDYYILRIYRRPDQDNNDILGFVEESASGQQWLFDSKTSLHDAIDKATASKYSDQNDLHINNK